MTTANERTRAILWAREFCADLMSDSMTREEAVRQSKYVKRHYPLRGQITALFRACTFHEKPQLCTPERVLALECLPTIFTMLPDSEHTFDEVRSVAEIAFANLPDRSDLKAFSAMLPQLFADPRELGCD